MVEEEDQGFDGCYGHGEIGVFAEEAVVGFDDAGGDVSVKDGKWGGRDILEGLGILLGNIPHGHHSGYGRWVSNWGWWCCAALVGGLEGSRCWNFESEG